MEAVFSVVLMLSLNVFSASCCCSLDSCLYHLDFLMCSIPFCIASVIVPPASTLLATISTAPSQTKLAGVAELKIPGLWIFIWRILFANSFDFLEVEVLFFLRSISSLIFLIAKSSAAFSALASASFISFSSSLIRLSASVNLANTSSLISPLLDAL